LQHKGLRIFAILASAGALCFPALSEQVPGIEGKWLAFESDLKTPRALIVIARDGDRIVGTVTQLLDQEENGSDPVCQRCEGAYRNRKIIGLPILFLGLEHRDGAYRGTILDPEDGRTYRCVVSPNATRDTLTIRGFVGMPIFGRDETWVRPR